MWPVENPFNALYGLLSHQMRKLIHQKLREPYGDLPRAHRIKIHWSNLLKLEKNILGNQQLEKWDILLFIGNWPNFQ